MESQNQQYLIAQELAKIECNINKAVFDVIGYELGGQYKIGISSNLGMFPGPYIALICQLQQEHKFQFYISDTCTAFSEGSIFIVIY